MKEQLKKLHLEEAVKIIKAYRVARDKGLKHVAAANEVATIYGCSYSKVNCLIYKRGYAYRKEAHAVIDKEEQKAGALVGTPAV